jgi:hypothetical protein
VASSCEHGDTHLGSIKCGEFLDYLSVLLASQEGLCSMELVSYQLKKNGVCVLASVAVGWQVGLTWVGM